MSDAEREIRVEIARLVAAAERLGMDTVRVSVQGPGVSLVQSTSWAEGVRG